MPDLIARLARLIVQDNAVLFVGAALRQQPGQEPLVQQIAQALAAQINYQRPDASLPAVARDYEVLRGRRALIQAVREQLQQADTHPTAIHQLIADAVLPNTKVITTRFDRILEHALDQSGKPYVLIVRDTDVPFFDESKITLIKMQGDITQPDSLVLTEDDIDAFIDRLPTISDVVRSFFATKTLIFLGYDLQSAPFKRFYNHVTRKLTVYRRQAYAITPQALPDIEQQYWEQQNVEVCEREPLTFLQTLATWVKAGVTAGVSPPPPIPAPTLPPPSAPYKGLASFSAGDQSIFFARTEASQRLTHRILAHRITLLYGTAGVGKTSLMQAGVRPQLRQMGAWVVDMAPQVGLSLEDGLSTALAESAAHAGLSLPPADSLNDSLRRQQHDLRGPIVIIIDPFEAHLAESDPAISQANWQTLQSLAEDRSLDLRWVWVLREDRMAELPAPAWWEHPALSARFRLDRLTREAAHSAIVEPAHQFDIEWAPAVVEQMLDELEDAEGRGILPAQLQLVCQRLFETLAPGERRITPAFYAQSGGVESLLSGYLDQVIASLPPDRQSLARTLLATLVTSGGSRQRLSLAELLEVVSTSPATAESLLDDLVAQHLLQRWEMPPTASAPRPQRLHYELIHDYLTTPISVWLNEAFWTAQKAREILRRHLPAWQQDGRLLATDDLRTVAALREQLRLTPAALDLLYASAVGLDADAAGWAPLLTPDRRGAMLVHLQDHADPSVRSRALRAMANCDTPQIVEALATAAVAATTVVEREAAATAIACALQDHGLAAPLQALLASATDSPLSPDLLHALTLIRDRAPASHALLPPSLRRPIQRRVWQCRWRRAWPRILAATAQGAQGGFWGLGFSLGLLLALASTKTFGDFVDLRRTVGLILAGVSLGGVIGALVVGGAAFIRTAVQALTDAERPRRTWLLTSGMGALMFALGMVVINFGARGPLLVGPMLATGALLGALLVGVATQPWQLPGWIRLLATMTVGIGAFLLVFTLNLAFTGAEWWWLVITGIASGAGMYAGLHRWLPGSRMMEVP